MRVKVGLLLYVNSEDNKMNWIEIGENMNWNIQYTTNCPECNGKMGCYGTSTTLLGGTGPEGHSHDPNCHKRDYFCTECDHRMVISKQVRCDFPGCNWVGEDECFCHPGKKVIEWPEEYRENK